MGRGIASKKMRCQNRAMASGRQTRGNSRAQAFMKNGFKANKQTKITDELADLHTTISVDGLRYIVAYAVNKQDQLEIHSLISENELRSKCGASSHCLLAPDRGGRGPVLPCNISDETKHKIARTLLDRLNK